MKFLSVVGARPEFIQAMPLSRVLRSSNNEVLVHTGQHYDYGMSRVFFEELSLPVPDYDLGVGSGSHGRQTGEMLARLEEVIVGERPDWVIVRGDTNSTLAGALAAAKLGVSVAHVEAGARSFSRTMPEEINRVLVDHVARLRFCISPRAVDNLAAEGIHEGVHVVGDVMYDAALDYAPIARERSRIQARLGVARQSYLLATVHRAANTDDAENLGSIVSALNELGESIVFPIHPRTRKAIETRQLRLRSHICDIAPVGYLDMLALEQDARAILTDSGGVTREAYFLGVPCITLREETEHVETVETGWNTLVGADSTRIAEAVKNFRPTGSRPPIFGDGHAAEKILSVFADSRQ